MASACSEGLMELNQDAHADDPARLEPVGACAFPGLSSSILPTGNAFVALRAAISAPDSADESRIATDLPAVICSSVASTAYCIVMRTFCAFKGVYIFAHTGRRQ